MSKWPMERFVNKYFDPPVLRIAQNLIYMLLNLVIIMLDFDLSRGSISIFANAAYILPYLIHGSR